MLRSDRTLSERMFEQNVTKVANAGQLYGLAADR